MLFAAVYKYFRSCRIAIYCLCAVCVYFIALNGLFPLPVYKIEKDFSTVHMDRNGEILRISLSPSQKYRIRMPLAGMSPYLKRGIVSYEDKYFYYHRGINPVSLLRAMYLNVTRGRIVSGASTVTMQIARMMGQRPRTVSSKIIEIFRALQLEFRYSKDELLEIYLNTIPMGGNIEGVGAGAYYYFGKRAGDLSVYESSLLIGLPNSPNRNRPDRYPGRAEAQMAKVLSRISHAMGISGKDLLHLKENKIDLNMKPFPFRCPHLIEAGKQDRGRFFVNYSVDLGVQNFCESVMARCYEKNMTQGIYNGAIIVANNRTREVLAYVGSPNYFDRFNCSQINGAAIARSPGSALKPFLYARGIEEGRITPGKKVLDIPIRDDEYSPANYSKSSLGPVTAHYALVHSLNIPAVRLERYLDRSMGGKGLKEFLKKVHSLPEDLVIEKSGLSVVLGGFPLTLERMTGLYMMMANGGVLRPLKFLAGADDKGIADRPVLTNESCYIISEMLSDCYRPDLPFSWEFTPSRSRVALKTGTSFGLKDAWCFGYNPDFTVGVWLGNADNRGSSHLVGVRKAAPLMMQIFNYVSRGRDSWFKRPAGVAQRRVCAVSGEKEGKYCGGKYKEDYFVKGVSSEKTCSVHRPVSIRLKDSAAVCPWCMEGDPKNYGEKIIEYWPGEVVSFFRKGGHMYSSMPAHNPACGHFYTKDKPRIIKPQNGTVFEIDAGIPLEIQKIPLKAFVAHDSDRVYWFLNNRLIHEGDPGDMCFLTPQKGSWTLSAIDSRGRSDSVDIRIY